MKYANTLLPQYKCYFLLGAIFIAIQLACTSTVHIIISIGSLTLPASGMIFISDYFLADILAEVYGYSLTRQVIWVNFICVAVFATIITTSLQLNHPSFWEDMPHYKVVYGQIIWTVISGIIAESISFFIDAYIISKTKIFMHGKKFWARCLFATAISELFLVTIAYTLTFLFSYRYSITINMIFSAWLLKVMAGILLIVPASLLTAYLKKAEGIDFYDTETDFNPLKGLRFPSVGINKFEDI